MKRPHPSVLVSSQMDGLGTVVYTSSTNLVIIDDLSKLGRTLVSRREREREMSSQGL